MCGKDGGGIDCSNRLIDRERRHPREALLTSLVAALRFGWLGRFGRPAVFDEYFVATGGERPSANDFRFARLADGVAVFEALKPHALSDAQFRFHKKARAFRRDFALNTFELLPGEKTIENVHTVFVDTGSARSPPTIIQ